MAVGKQGHSVLDLLQYRNLVISLVSTAKAATAQYDTIIGPTKASQWVMRLSLERTMGNPVPDSHLEAVLCPRRVNLANKDEHHHREFLPPRFCPEFQSLVFSLGKKKDHRHKRLTSCRPQKCRILMNTACLGAGSVGACLWTTKGKQTTGIRSK